MGSERLKKNDSLPADSWMGPSRTTQEYLDRFVSIIAHDFLAPIRHINRYSQVIQEQMNAHDHPDEIIRHANERLVHNADRLAAMIRDVRRLYQIQMQPLHLEPVRLASLVEAAVSSLNKPMQQQLKIILSQPSRELQVDQHLFIQLLFELLKNAIKFRQPEDLACRVRIEVSASGEKQLMLRFRDNGPGISPAIQDQVFEIFSRGYADPNDSSTGIGLCLCREIMTKHGGSIALISDIEHGCQFEIALPQ